jgi:hypothetical protein
MIGRRSLGKDKESLPCQLTEEQLGERARELARLVEAIEEEEDRAKRVAADSKSEVRRLAAGRDLLARVVSTGTEFREVGIEKFADDDRGIVAVVRMDTGEVVAERPIRAEERQLELGA